MPLDPAIETSIDRLDGWIQRNGWAGYGPYDVKGTAFGLAVQRAARRTRLPFTRLLLIAERTAPVALRRALRVDKQVNAKGMGLFAKAYLLLADRTGDGRYSESSDACFDWLLANAALTTEGTGWGYPFDWQSRVMIPEGTPSAVVSAVVGDAFWTRYERHGRRDALEVCTQVCEFFLNDLNIDSIDDDTVCFSYTPRDRFHVHNANLFVAEFLLRVGVETGVDRYVDFGRRAANYALRELNPDGSLFYWGRCDRTGPGHQDHYHSGFEIRALDGIARWTGDPEFRAAADRYYRFYRQRFFDSLPDGLVRPRHTPDSTYPIDIHSCAEAVLCNVALARQVPDAADIARQVALWAARHMQHEEGWFRYRISRVGPWRRAIDVPFMRWGQAWMLLALAELSGLGADAPPNGHGVESLHTP